MPVIDVFASASHPLVPDLAASPAGWYQIVVQEGFPEGDDLFALIGDPDRAEDDLVARLMGLNPAGVALPRLRDIFSLAHVGDIGDDEDGGEPEPTPEPPPSGGLFVVAQSHVEWVGQELEVFAEEALFQSDPLRSTPPAPLQVRLTS